MRRGPIGCFRELSDPGGSQDPRGSRSMALCYRARPVGLCVGSWGWRDVGEPHCNFLGLGQGLIQRPLVSPWCGFPSGHIPGAFWVSVALCSSLGLLGGHRWWER